MNMSSRYVLERLTECETISQFLGHGKVTVRDTWDAGSYPKILGR